MSDIKTVTLDGSELKVEGMGGQNTVIVNLGSATLYVSASAGVTPDGDNTAAIPSGGVMNLLGTNGTVYLLGTGKVELEGTDYADIGRAVVVSSGGGGGSTGGGVSREYVDSADAITLSSAKKYTDGEITAVNAEIDTVKEYTDMEISDLKAYIGYTDSDIYGLEADFENNKFTRLAGAVGKTPGADFDGIGAFGGRRRCAVSNDGTVNSYYGSEDWSEPDGWNETLSVNEQCMVEQPKFYYKVVPLKTEKIDGADGYHLRKARYYISDTPKPGFKVHPAFVQNGIEVDKIYLSAYEGAIQDISKVAIFYNDEQAADFDNDKLLSIARTKPASGTTQALTRANARKLAQNRGAGWGITTVQTLSATQLLFAVEYATFNSQTAIGNGVVNATESIKTGSTSSLGNASGSVASGGVSYRGEENLWGNIWSFADGINVFGQDVYVSDHDFADASGDVPYQKVKGALSPNNGNISAFLYDQNRDWLFMPSETVGNSALPVGDYFYKSNNAGRSPLVCMGGYNVTTQAGMFISNVHSDSHNQHIGARLIYIPKTEEVTAND